MGLFRRRETVPAEGEILVMAPTRKAARQTGKRNVDFVYRLRVSAPGREPFEVETTERTPYDRLPAMGQTLPLRVDAEDHARVEIDWDGVKGVAERAREAADAALRGDEGQRR